MKDDSHKERARKLEFHASTCWNWHPWPSCWDGKDRHSLKWNGGPLYERCLCQRFQQINYPSITKTASIMSEPFLNHLISIRNDLLPGDVGYITYLHGTLYAPEQGWDYTFDAYVAIPLAEFAKSHSSRERIWIVEKEGKIVGSVAIVEFSDTEAQLRWLLLDPDIRGQGLGRWLVGEALGFCRDSGYSSVFLWTVNTLPIAAQLYQSMGFKQTKELTHTLWGSVVTEVKYVLVLK